MWKRSLVGGREGGREGKRVRGTERDREARGLERIGEMKF
jgi:hypothetical protein